ncbi:reelin-like [Asterias rubens]|uniref:reelin-like n=1 Tax=Asterias rubens TaxID=7604 RepID=UPI00145562FD|nr:reelin-like [Asterias rubens]
MKTEFLKKRSLTFKEILVAEVEIGHGSYSSSTSLTFQSALGQHSVTTRDIDVNEHTMVQFEINAGCTDQTIATNPISLEYSRDYGTTWDLLKPDCFNVHWSSSLCSGQASEPSVYYIGEQKPWERVTILINGLHICGTVRFRWYQGFYRSRRELMHPWALDNIYIGPLCPQLCNGHGACIDGNQCVCDEGYSGRSCHLGKQNPRYLKETFEDSEVDSMKFLQWSGGEVTDKCGTLITGTSLHFAGNGKRVLVTRDLDLTAPSIVHFFIRLGCGQATPSIKNHPVQLQYSTNGGIIWNLIEEIDFNNRSKVSKYVMLELPSSARSNITRIRWWQPSHEGSFLDEWAIDQSMAFRSKGSDNYHHFLWKLKFMAHIYEKENSKKQQNHVHFEESQWDRVKKQVNEERPQEFAPPQQYNWMMPSMRQTPKKKSKFASTETCDDTLNTSKQPQECAPPSSSAK